MKFCTECKETLDNTEFSSFEPENDESVCVPCIYHTNSTFFSREVDIEDFVKSIAEMKRILWRHHLFIENENEHNASVFRECYRIPEDAFCSYMKCKPQDLKEYKYQVKFAKELIICLRELYTFQKHDHRERRNGISFEFVCQRMSRLNQLERYKKIKTTSSSLDSTDKEENNSERDSNSDRDYNSNTVYRSASQSKRSRLEPMSPCSGRITVSFESDMKAIKVLHSHIAHPHTPVSRVPNHVTVLMEDAIRRATDDNKVTVTSLYHRMKEYGVSRSQVRYQYYKITKNKKS